jgi:hypothetical protein
MSISRLKTKISAARPRNSGPASVEGFQALTCSVASWRVVVIMPPSARSTAGIAVGEGDRLASGVAVAVGSVGVSTSSCLFRQGFS